jgi:hypothetical protein
MALRVLTQEEKYSLSINETFKEKCKQAIRDFAAYWSIHDGSGFSTEAERVTWVKNRSLGVHIVKNPLIPESSEIIVWHFLNGAKGKQYDLNPSPIAVETLITAWDSANSFEEFVNEYFKVKGDDINFSVTGN